MSSKMASRLVFFISSIFLVLCFAVAEEDFDESNPILMVSDGLQELELDVIRVLGRTPHALRFARFAHKYEKKYETTEEMKRRFEIFLESLELIKSTNEKGLSYKLGVNEFADWTWEEFRQRRLLTAPLNFSVTSTTSFNFTQVPVPASRDWRKQGIVGPVKNQGGCGSCWAFSATGALEAAYTQLYRRNISLSEQQLIDCSRAFGNLGCTGGYPTKAFRYVKYNGGIVTEAKYPYTEAEGKCQYLPGQNVAVRVNKIVQLPQNAEYQLWRAVGLIRPVSVLFEVNDEFRLYKRGVFSTNTCHNSIKYLNHAVVVVGYGVNHAGVKFWIVKNSWGRNWGEQGYFKMKRGVNMCGIATTPSYPSVY